MPTLVREPTTEELCAKRQRTRFSCCIPVVSRYRICAMSNDIIVLEEILGYVLEALDVIEVLKKENSA